MKLSDRCGWSPNARQMRLTDIALTPSRLAMSRVLQWVAPSGLLSSARVTTCSTLASEIWRGAPGRGSSSKPSSRLSTKRDRHFPTVAFDSRSLLATLLLSRPSAQASTMAARVAKP